MPWDFRINISLKVERQSILYKRQNFTGAMVTDYFDSIFTLPKEMPFVQMPAVPRNQSNTWFYIILGFRIGLDLKTPPDSLLLYCPCFPVRFFLNTCGFPVLNYFQQRTHNEALERLFQEMQRTAFIAPSRRPSLPFCSHQTEELVEDPPWLSHTREKLPCALCHLPIMELSALGTDWLRKENVPCDEDVLQILPFIGRGAARLQKGRLRVCFL